MAVGWSQDDGHVVTFGRLYLHTLAPTRDCAPPASKATSLARLVWGLSTRAEGVASVTMAYVLLIHLMVVCPLIRLLSVSMKENAKRR